jgi:hypothetical protein
VLRGSKVLHLPPAALGTSAERLESLAAGTDRDLPPFSFSCDLTFGMLEASSR